MAEEEFTQTEETNPEERPEYATKADIKSIQESITKLSERLEQPDSKPLDATDQTEIDRLYQELYGTTAKPEATTSKDAEDPVVTRLTAIERAQAQLAHLLTEDVKTRRRAEIDAEYAKKLPQWNEWHDELWNLAKQEPYRGLSPEEIYALLKVKKEGVEALTPKEKETAKGAVKNVQEAAKRVSSEKPSTGVTGKTQQHTTWESVLDSAYQGQAQKPTWE